MLVVAVVVALSLAHPSLDQSHILSMGAADSAPQTPVQQRVATATRNLAIPAAAAAKDQVFTFIGSPITRKYLEKLDDGTGLHRWPTARLVQAFWDEVAAAELVHSFGDPRADLSANCGFDLTVDMGVQLNAFPNQWTLQALGLVPVDSGNNVFTEWSETVLFHFPPFANVSAPDVATARDRPVYGALNMYRISGGNPQCGPIAAVFSRAFLNDANILAAPVDTGFFQGTCSMGQQAGGLGNQTIAVCGAWDPSKIPLGSPPYLDHLLVPFLEFYNATQAQVGDEYPYLNLARLLTRLLSRRTFTSGPAMPLNFFENTLGYFELNPAAVVLMPQSIKMMVGMFELLWGTPTGSFLRQWCAANGWPLAWAYNPVESFHRCGPSQDNCTWPLDFAVGIEPANVRILDPSVLARVPAGHNVTTTPELEQKFNQLWGMDVSKLDKDQVQSLWDSFDSTFGQTLLAIEPLFHGACADQDCVGVAVQGGACVCSPSK